MPTAEERLRQLDADMLARIAEENAAESVLASQAEPISGDGAGASEREAEKAAAERVKYAIDLSWELLKRVNNELKRPNPTPRDLDQWTHDLSVVNQQLDSIHAAPKSDVLQRDYEAALETYNIFREKIEALKAAKKPDAFVPVSTAPKDLEERLQEAREKYAKAERELAKSSGLKSWVTDFSGKAKQKLAQEHAKLEADYKKSRAEFVGASVDNFLTEKTKLTEARLAEFAKRDKNPLETIAKWNQKLGEMNFVDKAGYKGPFKRIVKMANARTAISAGLMGLGFYNARSAFGGVTAGLGTYGMVLSAREAYLAKRFKGNESLQNTEQLMYSLESRAALDGKNEELLNNDTYKKVLARWEQLQRAEFVSLAGRDAENYIQKQMAKTDVLLQEKLEDERKWKKLAVIAGTGTGILVGLGVPGKIIGKAKDLLHGHHQMAVSNVVARPSGGAGQVPPPGAPRPELPGGGRGAVAPVEAPKPGVPTSRVDVESEFRLAPDAEKIAVAAKHTKEAITSGALKHGATFEIHGTDEFINVGKHGIEGVILDQSDPNYAATIEWLKHLDYNHGVTDPGALAHRYAEHLATEQGVSIDQLSHVLKGTQLVRHADGSLGLGHVDYYTPHAVADVAQHPSAPSGIPAGHEIPSPADVPAEAPLVPDYLSEDMGQGVTRGVTKAFRESVGVVDQDSTHDVAAHGFGLSQEEVAHRLSQTPVETASEIAADSVGKTSDGIRLILRENSDSFIKKFLHSSARNLNKIKDMTYGDFINKFNSDTGFAEKYGNLANQLKKARMIAGADSDLKMHKVIVELAKKFKSGEIR